METLRANDMVAAFHEQKVIYRTYNTLSIFLKLLLKIIHGQMENQ